MARSRRARTRKRSRKKRGGGYQITCPCGPSFSKGSGGSCKQPCPQGGGRKRRTSKRSRKEGGRCPPGDGWGATREHTDPRCHPDGGGKRRTSKRSRKKRGGVTPDCVRVKQPGWFSPLHKLDASHNLASCPKSQNCMMIDHEGNVSEECASAAARRVPGATIIGKCQSGNSCGIASRGLFGGRKRRKTKRKKGGGIGHSAAAYNRTEKNDAEGKNVAVLAEYALY